MCAEYTLMPCEGTVNGPWPSMPRPLASVLKELAREASREPVYNSDFDREKHPKTYFYHFEEVASAGKRDHRSAAPKGNIPRL